MTYMRLFSVRLFLRSEGLVLKRNLSTLNSYNFLIYTQDTKTTTHRKSMKSRHKPLTTQLTFLLLPWLMLLFATGTFADPISAKKPAKATFQFDNIATRQGLNNLSVLKVVQDPQGYIWVATQQGLYRYNGYDFKTFTHDPADPGSLADNYVNTLFIDQSDQLWIGTDAGLARYHAPSESFIHHQHQAHHPESLSGNVVMSIAQDHNGDLWIATLGGGLNRFDRTNKSFSHFKHDPHNPDSLSDDNVYTVLADRQGTIWAGTRDGGLNRLDIGSTKFKRYQPNSNNSTHNSLSHNKVYTLFEDSDQTLWVGTRGGGLNRFDRKTDAFQHFKHDPNDPNSLSGDHVVAIFEDKAGALWLGTERSGLNRFDPLSGRFHRYQHNPQDNHSLPADDVESIIGDQTGLIWLGTFGGGLSKFDPTSSRFGFVKHDATDPNSLSKGSVQAIFKDKAGVVWVGTQFGLNRYDQEINSLGHNFQHYQHDPQNPKSLSDSDVRVIFEDSTGTLWVGTNGGGLNQFNRANGTFIHYRHQTNQINSLSDDYVAAINEDNSGRLWIGTDGGLNRFNRQSNNFSRFIHSADTPTSISHNSINTLYTATDGTLWVGTDGGGLNQFNHQTQQFTRYQANANDINSLSHNMIFSIIQDATGVFWIGTFGGLNRFDANSKIFTHYRRKDGLSGDAVFAVFTDKKGNLWLGENGISFFDPATAIIKSKIGINEGCVQLNQGAYFKAADGQMFFGSEYGYCALYPENAIVPSQPPKLVFSDFRLLNKSMPIANNSEISPLTEVINVTQSLTLNHQQNVLSFEFAALHYANPELNQYQYKLEGFNQDWVDTSSKNRRASYTNLAAGHYTFKVKASNHQGVWTEQARSIKLIIHSAPWFTWWAYTIYLALTMAVISVIAYLYYKKLQVERQAARDLLNLNETLEHKVTVRTTALQASIDQLKATQRQLVEAEKMNALGNLVAGVAHEVNTPLGICITMVSLHLERLSELRQHLTNGTVSRKSLETYVQSSEESQALVEGNLHRAAELISSFKQVAVEQTADNIDNIVFHDYLTDIITSVERKLADRQIVIKLLSKGDWQLKTWPGAWWQILSNLVENSLVHGFYNQSSGEITIDVELCEDLLRFIYHDNGNGMTAEVLEKIYEPFYTTARNRGGTGLGLPVVFNLVVHKLGGSIKCYSEPGQGVEFMIEVPQTLGQ
ncbi:MAG: ligand-binding sensor domain-containing protein/signal transduction histidine kinase [Phenylobacterium sp.]|jgi:ligand-binding sensor domain-containing protein/signal transduction histidine kinase